MALAVSGSQLLSNGGVVTLGGQVGRNTAENTMGHKGHPGRGESLQLKQPRVL